MPEPSPPRRRLALGLRGLMLLVLLVGGAVGWVAYRARVQREIVAAICRAHGMVNYDFQSPIGEPPSAARRPPPRWLYSALGPDYLGDVVHVHAGSESGRPGRADDDLMAGVGRLGRLTELYINDNPSVTSAGLAAFKAGLRPGVVVTP